MPKRLYKVEPTVLEETVVLVSEETEYEMDEKTKAPKLKPETMTPVVRELGTKTRVQRTATRLEYPRYPGIQPTILWTGHNGEQVWLVDAPTELHAILSSDKRATWISWDQANRIMGGTLIEYVSPGEVEAPQGRG